MKCATFYLKLIHWEPKSESGKLKVHGGRFIAEKTKCLFYIARYASYFQYELVVPYCGGSPHATTMFTFFMSMSYKLIRPNKT